MKMIAYFLLIIILRQNCILKKKCLLKLIGINAFRTLFDHLLNFAISKQNATFCMEDRSNFEIYDRATKIINSMENYYLFISSQSILNFIKRYESYYVFVLVLLGLTGNCLTLSMLYNLKRKKHSK
jgi:hypothetical protein